jgi:hypothetical protein
MTTSTANKPDKTKADPSGSPPEEQFWQRYSPHGEMPLSMAGSVAVHALVIGGLVLTTIYFASLFFKPNRSLPVEPVRLIDGGGGGQKGVTGTGTGTGGRVEDTGAKNTGNQPGTPEKEYDVPPPPKLSPAQVTDLNVKFDPDTVRYIKDNNTPGTAAFAQLPDMIRKKLSDGLNPGGGGGGSGSGGGTGTGKGTGTGSGTGPGSSKATLSQREKRMLRWTMRFTANNGPEYLNQLSALGAILAIPVVEHPEPQYKLVRDLKRIPAVLVEEDLSKIERIYWIDSNPRSINDVMTTLRVPFRPSRFVAFMPKELEDKLFEMEKKAMIERRRIYNEDQIEETIFRVMPLGGGHYRPQLTDIRFK